MSWERSLAPFISFPPSSCTHLPFLSLLRFQVIQSCCICCDHTGDARPVEMVVVRI